MEFGHPRRLQHTREGEFKGKLAYVAPEQLSGAVLSQRIDIYAASVVLWETLTSRRLFSGESEEEVFRKVIEGNVVAPSQLEASIPEALDALVLRGLSRSPEERFASAEEMALALERAVAPASSRQIAAWVRSLASEALATRAALVAKIESSPLESPPAQPIVGQTHPVAPPRAAVAEQRTTAPLPTPSVMVSTQRIHPAPPRQATPSVLPALPAPTVLPTLPPLPASSGSLRQATPASLPATVISTQRISPASRRRPLTALAIATAVLSSVAYAFVWAKTPTTSPTAITSSREAPRLAASAAPPTSTVIAPTPEAARPAVAAPTAPTPEPPRPAMAAPTIIAPRPEPRGPATAAPTAIVSTPEAARPATRAPAVKVSKPARKTFAIPTTRHLRRTSQELPSTRHLSADPLRAAR
ncbi:MAG: serine/threonine protein kinase [Myxococcota bacterium]